MTGENVTGAVFTGHPATGPDRCRDLKVRQQAMWAWGDFAVAGTTLQTVGELLCERWACARMSVCSTRDHEAAGSQVGVSRRLLP